MICVMVSSSATVRVTSMNVGTAWCAFILLTIAACGATPPPRSSPTVSKSLCPFEAEDAHERLLQWSLGCDVLRGAEPRSSEASVVTYGNAKSAFTGPPGKKYCVGDATALLSVRGDVYLIKGGLLFTLDLASGKTRPVNIQDHGKEWRFSQLLGFSRAPTPLTLLVEMTRGRPTKAKSIWEFSLHSGVFKGREVPADTLARSAESFSRRYFQPRCLQEYTSCLVLTGGALSVKNRGQRTQSAQRPPAGWVLLDAVHHQPGDAGKKQIMALVSGPCRTP